MYVCVIIIQTRTQYYLRQYLIKIEHKCVSYYSLYGDKTSKVYYHSLQHGDQKTHHFIKIL